MNSLVFVSVCLVFSQNGLIHMCQAAGCDKGRHCSPSRNSYLNSQESIIGMRLHATNMAKALMTNTEILTAAATSSDPTHRVAAAFACGMKGNPDEVVYLLATDVEPIVCQAARESLVYVATTRNRSAGIDFGPYPNSESNQKDDSVKLWRLYFQSSKIQNTKATVKPTQVAGRCLQQSGAGCIPIHTKPRFLPETSESTKIYQNLPKNKPNLVQVETEDDSIPGFRIKRVTTKQLDNDH